MTDQRETETVSGNERHDAHEQSPRNEPGSRESGTAGPATENRAGEMRSAFAAENARDQSNAPVGTAGETGSIPADTAELVRTRNEHPAPVEHRRPAAETGHEARARSNGGVPIPDYQRLTVPEIIRHAGTLPVEGLRELKEYEKSHRRRKTLLTKLERMLRNPDAGKATPAERPAAAGPPGTADHPHRA